MLPRRIFRRILPPVQEPPDRTNGYYVPPIKCSCCGLFCCSKIERCGLARRFSILARGQSRLAATACVTGRIDTVDKLCFGGPGCAAVRSPHRLEVPDASQHVCMKVVAVVARTPKPETRPKRRFAICPILSRRQWFERRRLPKSITAGYTAIRLARPIYQSKEPFRAIHFLDYPDTVRCRSGSSGGRV